MDKLKSYCQRTVVKSHCGSLEYLSPLGVEMLIQLSMKCPTTTVDTATTEQKKSVPSPFGTQRGPTVAKRSKKQTPVDAVDAPTLGSLENVGLSNLAKSLELPNSPQIGNPSNKQIRRNQFGAKRIPKKFLSSPTHLHLSPEDLMEESITSHLPEPRKKEWFKTPRK